MTVAEYFAAEKLTMNHVNNIRDESDYWEKAGVFVLDNWDRDLESLSHKQVEWLSRIQDDLTEKRIEGKL